MNKVQFKSHKLFWRMPSLLVLAATHAVAAIAAIPEQDCVIEPSTVVDLASSVEGIVESVEVTRGDLVERGEVLVKLDAGVERAAVEYARARAQSSAQLRAGEANASFALRRANRVSALQEQTLASTDQRDEAETQARLTRAQAEQAAENRRLAKLELAQAEENLARHVIRSPIRGVVVEDYLSPGESVKDKPILRLAEIDPLRVEVIVPVAFIDAIKPGQMATVRPEEPRTSGYQAKVTIVDRVANAASGTFRVRLSMANSDFSVPSGLKCRIQFAATPVAPLAGQTAPAHKAAAAAPAPSAPAPSANARSAAATTQPVSTAAVRPVNAGSAVAARETPSTPRSCHSLGPIGSKERADQVRAALDSQVRQVALREEKGEQTADYVLLSPAHPSLDEARALEARYRAAGVEDLFLFRRGTNANRLSLGVYDREANAETRRRELAALGFESEIVPRRRQVAQLWLDVEARETAAAIQALATNLAPDLELRSVACPEVMASHP